MTRRSVIQKAVEAQEKAPVTAWVIWVGSMCALGWRVAGHDSVASENWKHMVPDAVLLLLAIVAAPGFMRYAGKNAAILIDLYRRFKGARESKSEADKTLPPNRGGGGR